MFANCMNGEKPATMSLHCHEEEIFHIVDNYVHKPGAPPKNIVINFDGTGGQPSWAVQDSREVPLYTSGGGLSNPCKLHLYAGGVIDNSREVKFENQLAIYYKGVGTWGEESFIGGLIRGYKSAFGAGAMHMIYSRAYEHLQKVYCKGDNVYIFGFSRGAATARLFASFLSKEENKIHGETPKIKLLGVFDTVVQSSDCGTSEEIFHTDVHRKSGDLPDNVEKAVHLVSIDERREPFRPTLFNADPRVTEVWCPGNHSDVGGGYYHDGLSDCALVIMMKEAELAGMKFREITKDIDPKDLTGDIPIKNFGEFDKDMKIDADPLDPDIHDENTLMYWFDNWWQGFKHRIVRVVRDDKDTDEPVLILEAAAEKMKKWNPKDVPSSFLYAPYGGMKYTPENLEGIPHKIVRCGDNGIEVVEGSTL